jgi:hypothetical protein
VPLVPIGFVVEVAGVVLVWLRSVAVAVLPASEDVDGPPPAGPSGGGKCDFLS